jgi:hypothetical protein
LTFTLPSRNRYGTDGVGTGPVQPL